MATQEQKKAIIAEFLRERSQAMNRARTRALSPSKRKRIAKAAAAARWAGRRERAL